MMRIGRSLIYLPAPQIEQRVEHVGWWNLDLLTDIDLRAEWLVLGKWVARVVRRDRDGRICWSESRLQRQLLDGTREQKITEVRGGGALIRRRPGRLERHI